MPFSEGFPRTLTEYVEVWCADLVAILTPDQRRDLIQGIAIVHTGGGQWPSRLEIQRLAEQISGAFGPVEVFIGEIHLRVGGGVDQIISRLADPENSMRKAAREQLHMLPGTPEVIAAVEAAAAGGFMTPELRRSILTAVLAHPILPEPIPAPPAFPALPPDHPESWGEKRRRDPGSQAWTPTPEQAIQLKDLSRQREDGVLDTRAFRIAVDRVANADTSREGAPQPTSSSVAGPEPASERPDYPSKRGTGQAL